MNIIKAILLTFFVTVVYYIPQAILVLLAKNTDWNINLHNSNFEMVWNLSSVVAYLLIFHLFWKSKPKYSTILDSDGLNFYLIPYLMLVVVGLWLVGQPFWDYSRIIDYFQNSNFEPYTSYYDGLNLRNFYRLLGTLIIAPIFEELFFRKFLFSKLRENHQLYVSILISSICFSAIHFETPGNLIPSFIFGVISCIIYFKTKKISYSILIHFLNNLLVSLFNTSYGEPYFNWLDGQQFDLIYWTLFVFGILIATLGVKKITTANKT